VTPDRKSLLRAAGLLLWLALFAALYTAGELAGLWPDLPPGALRDLDLAAGFAGAAALCIWLLRRGRPRAGDPIPTRQSEDTDPRPAGSESSAVGPRAC